MLDVLPFAQKQINFVVSFLPCRYVSRRIEWNWRNSPEANVNERTGQLSWNLFKSWGNWKENWKLQASRLKSFKFSEKFVRSLYSSLVEWKPWSQTTATVERLREQFHAMNSTPLYIVVFLLLIWFLVCSGELNSSVRRFIADCSAWFTKHTRLSFTSFFRGFHSWKLFFYVFEGKHSATKA